MSENLRLQLAQLPTLLAAHVLLSTLALALGVGISLPLAFVVARAPRLRWGVLGLASVVQTIPSLALLALMVPTLGAFGFKPALAALVLYSALPILRNTVTGIANVDAAVLEAATAMGMTPFQRLARVELPLALPVIVAGIRTATIWTVGVATLSTPVGQPSLGNYIFGGLQTRNHTAVLVGCAAAALLALTLDALLGMLESGVASRRPQRSSAALLGLALVLGGGVLAPSFARSDVRRTTAALTPAPQGQAQSSIGAPAARKSDAPIRIGSKTFTEQYILAGVLEESLARAGLATSRTDSLGSSVAFDALTNGDIDVYVEYTGTIWANYMKRGAPESSWRTLALASAWLAEVHGVRLLGALGFENAYALAMRRERARALGIGSVADLSAHASALALGSDYEFLQRPEWARLAQTYDLHFSRTLSFDPSFMYSAVAKGEVDVIAAFSSDGRIAAFDLEVLGDPKQAFPPYDAVLLLSPRMAALPRATRALEPLLGKISVELMRQASLLVDREGDKKTPGEAADWLLGQLK